MPNLEEQIAESYRRGLESYKHTPLKVNLPEGEQTYEVGTAAGGTPKTAITPIDIKNSIREAEKKRHDDYIKAQNDVNIIKSSINDFENANSNIDKINAISKIPGLGTSSVNKNITPEKKGILKSAIDDFYTSDFMKSMRTYSMDFLKTMGNIIPSSVFSFFKGVGEMVDSPSQMYQLRKNVGTVESNESIYNRASMDINKIDEDFTKRWNRLSAREQMDIANSGGITPEKVQNTIHERTYSLANQYLNERHESERHGLKQLLTGKVDANADNVINMLADEFFWTPFASSISHEVSDYATKQLIQWGALDAKYANEFYSNTITAVMASAVEDSNKWAAMPEVKDPKNPYKDLNWYYSMLKGTANSIAEFLPIMIGVSKGTSALMNAGRGAKILTEAFNGLNKLRAFEQNILHSVTSGFLSNNIEGQIMAADAYTTSMEQFKPYIEDGSISKGEAEYYATSVSDKLAAYNMSLMATNMIEMAGLFKGKGWLYKELEEGGWKGFKNSFNFKKTPIMENAIIQNSLEAGEEGVQGSLENQARYDAKKKMGLIPEWEQKTLFSRILDDISDPDIQSQMIAGFLSPGIQRSIIKTFSGDYGDKAKEEKASLKKRIEQVREDNREYFLNRLVSFKKYMDNSAEAQFNNDKISEDILHRQHFLSIVMANVQAGTLNEFEAMLKGLDKTSISEKELKERGWSKDFKSEIKDNIASVNEIKKLYNSLGRYENAEEILNNRLTKSSLVKSLEDLDNQKKEIEQKKKNTIESSALSALRKIRIMMPDFQFKYKENKKTGVQEPSFDINDYNDEIDSNYKGPKSKTTVKREIESYLNNSKDAITSNPDYNDITNDFIDNHNNQEKLLKTLELIDSDYSKMKSVDYQVNFIKEKNKQSELLTDLIKIKKKINKGKASQEKYNELTHKKFGTIYKNVPTEAVQKEQSEKEALSDLEVRRNRALSEIQDTGRKDKSGEKIYTTSLKNADNKVVATFEGTKQSIEKSLDYEYDNRKKDIKPAVAKPVEPVVTKEHEKKEEATTDTNEETTKPVDEAKQVEPKIVSTTKIEGRYNHKDGTVSKDKVEFVIEDMVDGTKKSFIAINGVPQDVKEHTAEETDEEILDTYQDWLTDVDIKWDVPRNINTEPLNTIQDANLDSQQNSKQEAIGDEYEDGKESVLDSDDESEKEQEVERQKRPLAASFGAFLNRLYKALTPETLVSVDDNLIGENNEILNFDKIGPNTKLTFEVDDDDSNIITDPDTNETTTWGIYKNKPNANITENIPIVVKDKNGNKLFYVHQTSWINERNTQPKNGSSEQEEDRNKNRAIRKSIIESKKKNKEGKTIASGKIRSYDDGVLFRTQGGKQFRTSEMMEDENLIIATAKNNELFVGEGVRIPDSINSKLKFKNDFHNGVTYAIIKVNRNAYRVIPLRSATFRDRKGFSKNQTTRSYLMNTIKIVLDIAYSTSESLIAKQMYEEKFGKQLPAIIKSIENAFGLNIRKTNKFQKVDTRKFLENFFYFRDMGNNKSLEEFFANEGSKLGSNHFVIGVIDGVVVYGTMSNNQNKITNAAEAKAFIEYVSDNKDGVDIFFNTNKKNLSNNKKFIVIDDNGDMLEKTYKQVVKDNTTTNIQGHNIGTKENPFYTYTIHPAVQFEVDGQEVEKDVVATINEETGVVKSDSKVKPEKTNTAHDELSGWDTDYYLEPASDEDKTGLEEQTEEISVKGLSAAKQFQLIKYLTYKIVNNMLTSESQRVETKVAFAKLLEQFQKRRELIEKNLANNSYNEEEQAKANIILKDLHSIEDGWGVITNMTYDALNKIRSVKFINQDGSELDDESITTKENANWDSVSAFTMDSRDSASLHVKHFFSAIEETYYDEQGNLKVKQTFFGAPMPVSFDDAYNTCRRILSNHGQDRSVKRYIEVLRSYKKSFPFLEQIAMKLESGFVDESTKNEFLKVMTSHYIGMRFFKMFKNNKGKFTSVMWADDSSSAFRSVMRRWDASFTVNNIVINAYDDENGDQVLVYDKDIVNKLNGLLFINKDKNNKVTARLKTEDGEEIISLQEKAIYERKKATGRLKKGEENSALEFTEKDYNTALDVLKNFGITLSDTTWQAMKDGKYKMGKSIKTVPFYDLFLNSQSPFLMLMKKTSSNYFKADEHPLDDNIITRLARFEAEHSPHMYSDTFLSAGKMVQSFSNNKYLIERFMSLKEDKQLLKKLIVNPFTKDSIWLKKMLKTDADGYYVDADGKRLVDKDGVVTGEVEFNDESSFNESFDYWTVSLEPFKTTDKASDSHEFRTLTDLEHELFRLQGIQNIAYAEGNKGQRVISVLNPTSSDKTTALAFMIEAMNIPYDMATGKFKIEEGQKHSTAVEMLFKHVVIPEINSIINFNKQNNQFNNKAYTDGGGSLFYFFKTLNTEIPNLFKLSEDRKTRIINENIFEENEEGEALRDAIKLEVGSYVNSLIEQKLEFWKEYGIGEKMKNGGYRYFNSKFVEHNERGYKSDDKVTQAASDMVIQSLFANANIFQLFVGNPAEFFKAATNEKGETLDMSDENIPAHLEETQTNIGKRLASDIAPGSSYFTKEDGNMRCVYIKDPKMDSLNIAQLNKSLKDKSSKYKGIAIADGQGLSSTLDFCFGLWKQGKITDVEWKHIQEVIKNANGGYYELGTKLTKKIILNVEKPVYVDNIYDDTNKAEYRVYIKPSVFPLLPELTTGLDIDKLRAAMETQDENGNYLVDKVFFSSAVKSGMTKSINIFGSDSGISMSTKEIVDEINKEGVIQFLPRTGYKIQQEVPYKEKTSIGTVTQAAKGLFTDLLEYGGFVDPKTNKETTGRELKKSYDDLHKQLFQQFADIFKDKISYRIEDGVIYIDKKSFIEIIEKEAKERGWPPSEVKNMTNPDFFDAIPFSSFAERYESVLMSIISNNIIKIKMPGMSSVLGTQAGFKSTDMTREEFLSSIKGKSIVTTPSYDHSKGLQPAGIREDGKWHPAQAFIPMKLKDANGKSIDINDFVDSNGVLDMSKVDKDILNIIGMRIPNQGLNSSSLIEVVGFTKRNSGDLFIATGDFVTQMGSDFDIDKLYSYISPIKVENGKMMKYTDSIDHNVLKQSIQKVNDDILEREEEIKNLSAVNNIDEIEVNLKKIKHIQEEINRLVKERKELYGQNVLYTQSSIIDIYKAVLGNPSEEVQKLITTPLDYGDLEDISKEMARIKNKKNPNQYKSSTILSDAYQKEKFINATAGKDGVAIFSLSNTANSAYQFAKKDDEGLTIYHNNSPLIVKFGKNKSLGNLSGSDTFNGNKKSEIIKSYQSVSVDNEKLQILGALNINKYTFNVIRLMNQLGFEQETLYLINQPIVLEYIKELKKIQGKFDEYTDDAKSKAREIVMKKYSDNYIARREQEIHIVNGADNGLDFYKEMFEFENDVNSYKSEIDDNDGIMTEDYYNDTQCSVLDKFIFLELKGKELGFLESTSNIDSGGIGVNVTEMLIKKQNIESILNGETNIINAERIFGDVDEDTGEFTPTTIAGYAYEYGVKLANKLYIESKNTDRTSGIFKYDTKAFKHTHEQVLAFSKSKIENVKRKSKMMRSVWDSMRAYLMSADSLWRLPNSDTIVEARQNMMYDTYKMIMSLDENQEEQYTPVIEHKSLAYIINEIQQLKIGENTYIERLDTKPANKPSYSDVKESGEIRQAKDISLIRFDATSKEGYGEQQIYASFLDLLQNDRKITNLDGTDYIVDGKPYMTSSLAQDLILYTYANGAKQEAIQFLKYIPMQFLHTIGVFEKLTDIDYNKLEAFGHSENLDFFTPSSMTRQIFQHSPELAVRMSDIKAETLMNDGDGKVGATTTFVIAPHAMKSKFLVGGPITQDGEADIPVPFISVFNAFADTSYSLYEFDKLDKDGNFIYKQIDTLGTFGMSEYNFGVARPTSLVWKNRSIVKNDSTLKPSQKSSNNLTDRQKSIPTNAENDWIGKYNFNNVSGEKAKERVASILEKISKESNNSLFKTYASDLLTAIGSIQLEKDGAQFSLEQGKFSSYITATHTLTIDTNAVKTINEFERVFLHELTHVLTSRYIRMYGTSEFESLTPDKKAAILNIINLYKRYNSHFKNNSDLQLRARYDAFDKKNKLIKAYKEAMAKDPYAMSLEELQEEATKIENDVINAYKQEHKVDVSNSVKSITVNKDNKITALKDIYSSEDRKIFYATANPAEFVTEMMTNEAVIKQGLNIQYDEKENKSFTSKFIDFLKDLFDSFTGKNISSEAIKNILGLIEVKEQSEVKQQLDATIVKEDDLFSTKNEENEIKNPFDKNDKPIDFFLENPGNNPDLKFFNINKKAILKYFGRDSMSFSEYLEELDNEPSKSSFFDTITRCY